MVDSIRWLRKKKNMANAVRGCLRASSIPVASNDTRNKIDRLVLSGDNSEVDRGKSWAMENLTGIG